ncbi:MAG: septum formation initiator family protein [Johnsonella sp.]|nr:septum formation initiator family protein [Johnsonella sp.]
MAGAGNRQRKKNQRMGRHATILAVAIAAFSIAMILNIRVRSLKEQESVYKERIQSIQTEYEAESERAQALEEYRIYVQTKQYIEKVAKEKLGLVKPDEIILKPNE